MKRVSWLALMAMSIALVTSGCGDDPVSPSAGGSEQNQTIDRALAENSDLAENDTYLAPGESEFADEYGASASGSDAAMNPFSTAEAIRPVFFYRVIREHQHEVQVETEQDSVRQIANVLVIDRFAGSFNIVARDSTDTGVVRRLIQKRLRDVGRLRARLARRIGDDPNTVGSWHLVAVSNRRIASPEHATEILEVRLQARSGLDVTITEPLALMRFPEELPKAVVGEWVKVTVRTADPTDALFLLAGWGRQRMRRADDGSFVGAFQAPYALRFFRIGVNALDHGTLFDDQAPYDSDFWGLLAHTRPPTLAAQE